MKWSDLAERQVLKAKLEGQLDNLPGSGRPISAEQGGSIESAGFRIMAKEGVVPREIELKKSVELQRTRLANTTGIASRKIEMKRLADLELRLAIEQEARRKYYRTG